MVGTFILIYKVVDGDRNMMSSDEKTVTVTLMVTQPMISLVDGEKTPTSRVVLVQDVALLSAAPITLPKVDGGFVGFGEHEHEHHLRLDVGENA